MIFLLTDREMIPIITIKDVARELGVSYSSISRAFNGKEGVSKATRDKILEAAEIMGYQPNDLARGLVNKISKTVGVIVPDINNRYTCLLFCRNSAVSSSGEISVSSYSFGPRFQIQV